MRVLLAGDETAAPAICSILETLPEGYAGHALIEVPSLADAQDVDRSAGSAGVALRWLERGDRPHGEVLTAAVHEVLAGGTPDDEVSADLEDVDVDADILWETPQFLALREGDESGGEPVGDFYAWLAGEAGVIKELRRLLVRDHGVDRHKVAFMGYWRAGRSEN